MLALYLQRELEKAIVDEDITVEEAIEELAAIHMQEVKLGKATIQNIPKPTALGAKILKKASITLPTAMPKFVAKVSSKKKLPSERKTK